MVRETTKTTKPQLGFVSDQNIFVQYWNLSATLLNIWLLRFESSILLRTENGQNDQHIFNFQASVLMKSVLHPGN
jgi:hypothetical protein